MASLRTWLVRVSRILAVLFLLLIAVGYGLFGTSYGLSVTAGLISSLASNEEQGIEIEGLESLLGKISVAAVRLTDRDGIWLEARDLTADFSLLDLLALDVSVDGFSMSSLSIMRAPLPSTQQAAPDPSAPLIPQLPVRSAFIKQITIDQITLHDAVLGKVANLTLAGNVRLVGAPFHVSGQLDMRHLDAGEGGLQAQWDIAPSQERRKISLHLSEPRGGLAARLLDMDALPAIDIRLQGDGPFDDWTANLSANLDGKQTVAGQMTIDGINEKKRLAAKLVGQLTPFLPKSLVPLVAGQSNLELIAEQTADNVMQIRQLDFSSALATLKASGFYDGRDQSLDFKTRFELGAQGTEIEFQQPEQPSLHVGHVVLDGQISGSLETVNVKMSGLVDHFEQGDVSLGGVKVAVVASSFDLIARAGALRADVTLADFATGVAQIDAITSGTAVLTSGSRFVGGVDQDQKCGSNGWTLESQSERGICV